MKVSVDSAVMKLGLAALNSEHPIPTQRYMAKEAIEKAEQMAQEPRLGQGLGEEAGSITCQCSVE